MQKLKTDILRVINSIVILLIMEHAYKGVIRHAIIYSQGDAQDWVFKGPSKMPDALLQFSDIGIQSVEESE